MKKLIYSVVILLSGLFVLTATSCNKKTTPGEDSIGLEQMVSLEETALSLKLGDEAILSAVFGEGVVSKRTYHWQSSDVTVVSVTGQNNHRALLTAKKEGRARITYRSLDGKLSATCDVEVFVESGDVIPDGDGVIRILAIGNSFSDDALEHYLYGLAKASDISVVIGNMYIGASTLSRHVEEIGKADGTASYSYRKINVAGTRNVRENISLATALTDEQWDYVSFQQASPNSGQYNTYVTPLPVLYNYVKGQLNNRSDVKYVFHQTWAYQQTSDHAGFAAYGNNQLTMYNAIVDAVDRATQLINIDVVVPAGTAIQNGRTSVIGDSFCRDGYHLDVNIGRYTASCAWYEAIFGRSVIGNTFRPSTLSGFEVEIAQHAAHFAMQKPKVITEMTAYQSWPNSGLPMADVFVDFSRNSSTQGWNAFAGTNTGYRLNNLLDKNGDYTGISIEAIEGFNGHNSTGASTSNTAFNMPSAVSGTSFFGNSAKEFEGSLVEKSVLKLTGLDKDKQYNFCFFSSRMSVTDNRETSFTLTGQSQSTVLLNASNNTSAIVCANSIKPNANGEIEIKITSGPNNNNATGFYYINAMRIALVN